MRVSIRHQPSPEVDPMFHAVFVTEQGFSIDDEIDDYDERAVSFLLNVLQANADGSEKRIPIGTVRIVPGINKVSELLYRRAPEQSADCHFIPPARKTSYP